MIERRIFHLVHDLAVQRTVDAVRDPAYAGCKVTITPPAKTRPQEERAHAMFGDIAKQFLHHGRRLDTETVKRLCIDQFRRDSIHDAELRALWDSMGTMELMPSLDGTGIVSIGWQSRHFPKKLYSALIEWLLAFGANNDIRWSNEARERAAA